MSEFSEAFRGAYAIHCALSAVVSKMTSGAPINVAEVVRQLGVEASAIPERELVNSIVGAAEAVGVKIAVDDAPLAI